MKCMKKVVKQNKGNSIYNLIFTSHLHVLTVNILFFYFFIFTCNKNVVKNLDRKHLTHYECPISCTCNRYCNKNNNVIYKLLELLMQT